MRITRPTDTPLMFNVFKRLVFNLMKDIENEYSELYSNVPNKAVGDLSPSLYYYFSKIIPPLPFEKKKKKESV